ncbi:hypothetical protein NPA31_007260 [Aurantimonas sp. MSK8Z-1]|uniref:hypothetical protein n=1 Tax=Mangrovibrevibacter kandeliae TaxID=2968473 RepID=UPI0021198516|nr:hypothetical protein [Aurantimonas sp. MSK8Z-1]MCW4114760.1 hypothetical protein [Aurantimonas sp. MSK8Z-1]
MKREALIRELRKVARESGIEFQVFENNGKGSHYRVRFGTKTTTLKSGDLTPTYVKLVKRQLGVD